MNRTWLLLFLFTSSGCLTVQSSPPDPAGQSSEWTQWADPAAVGFDENELELARLEADRVQSAAVMAVVNGGVLFAWGDVHRKLELHSVRKSLYSALWGIAEARGLVDLRATLAELGVDDLQQLSEREKSARLIDLLQARSGVYHPAAYAAADDRAARPDRGAHAPGTFWYYNNWDFNLAGALLEKITGKPLGVLFDEWIAEPTGMEDFEPADVYAVLEPGQSRWPALTLRMSTRDLARFGQLWLDRGKWSGYQVVPEEWVDRASEAASETGPGQGYAMMWWTYQPGSISAEYYPNASRREILLARGTGGQALFVIPEENLVFVHRGDTDHGRRVSGGDIWSMLERVLAARQRQPGANPVRVSLTAVPLESQIPAFEWPDQVRHDLASLESFVGEYEFGPGMVGRIFLYEGRLFAYMPGEGEAELFAKSDDEFFLRVDPTVNVRFDREEGTVTITLGGQELVGRRPRG